MFTVNDLSKRFGESFIFEHVSFSINPGDRIGLVGPNGSGKTTLLRILVGEESQETGSLSVAPGVTLGYLRQGFSDIPDGTLGDLVDVPLRGLIASHRALDEIMGRLADPNADPASVARIFERANDLFESLGGYAALDELEALLDRFGLGEMAMDRPLDQLSGGQKTRAGLAALLASRPDLLVLDEPTNHLDADAMAWLAEFLDSWRGAMLIVSHDRGFLDDVVTKIFALDPLTGALSIYAGDYSDYVEARRHEEDEAEAAWSRQQAEVTRIKRDIRAAESKARSIEASSIDYAVLKKAAKIARPAVVRKRKLERMLDAEDAASMPVRRWGMSLNFAENNGGARDAIRLTDVHVSLGNQVILKGINLLVRHGDRVALLGPNGSGKTTLMRTISGELEPESGTVRIGSGVQVGYFAQEQQTLDPGKTVLEQAYAAAQMPESELRTFLHKFLFDGETVHRRVAELSYGERARLMLATLVLKETSVLLLDEPLNHLDIDAREEFEQALAGFNGTTVMVLHDRYAIDRLANRVVHMLDGGLVEITSETIA
ncbi:MAG TPA: ABC-F family ATP-binding cassette domain-containing protein [Thermomicrobiales bacterium]|nr:ABC-F family ATP-binding cassette domain-containing protein [Thermomicrobiales bacterium]